MKKKIYFLAYVTPRSPMDSHKTFQPIWLSRLAIYREHIYKQIYMSEELNHTDIFKVVISVLFVCPITTQEPLDRFSLNFDWGTRKNHRNVLSWILRF